MQPRSLLAIAAALGALPESAVAPIESSKIPVPTHPNEGLPMRGQGGYEHVLRARGQRETPRGNPQQTHSDPQRGAAARRLRQMQRAAEKRARREGAE